MSYRRSFTKKDKDSKVRMLPFNEGILFLNNETRNLRISLTDLEGRIYINSSGGKVGFKNTLKKTALAAETAVESLVSESIARGLKRVHVKCKGFNNLRNPSLRYLINRGGLEILDFEEKTRIAHGGCRPRKMKRN